jgi:hypothetical protein
MVGGPKKLSLLSDRVEVVTDQKGKEDTIYNAYLELLGTCAGRDTTLNLHELELGLNRLDLHELDVIVTEEEAWSVIQEIPSEPQARMALFWNLLPKRLACD